MDSIRDLWLKIKLSVNGAVGNWGVPLLLILIAIISFGLGRLSDLEENRPGIAVSHPDLLRTPPAIHGGGIYVASKTGSEYYFPWCKGVENIPDTRQIFFHSEAAAKNAGYKPAKDCKGLGEIQ